MTIIGSLWLLLAAAVLCSLAGPLLRDAADHLNRKDLP